MEERLGREREEHHCLWRVHSGAEPTLDFYSKTFIHTDNSCILRSAVQVLTKVQGDTSGSFQPPIDIKTKVKFQTQLYRRLGTT